MNDLYINGLNYVRMDETRYARCFDSFDICDNLMSGEYAPYYGQYIFKNGSKCFAVDVDDLEIIVKSKKLIL